jgi:autotransporter adhesin
VAIGRSSTAGAASSIALGDTASAASVGNVAIGQNASASGANSVAIGAGSSDGGQSNVVSVGSVGAERRITNVAPGINGTDAVNVNQLTAAMASTLASANAYTNQQIANVNFDLGQLRNHVNQGVAAAMAMADAPFPSAPGRTSYTANTAIYYGKVAFSASLSHRLNTDSPFAITGAVTYGGGNGVGGRAGVAGEF